MLMSRPSKAVWRLISLIGCFLASEKVRCRYKMGALNVSVSISSEPAAYTWQECKYRCENDQGTYFVTTSKFCTLCLGLRGCLNGIKMRWIHFPWKNSIRQQLGFPWVWGAWCILHYVALSLWLFVLTAGQPLLLSQFLWLPLPPP